MNSIDQLVNIYVREGGLAPGIPSTGHSGPTSVQAGSISLIVLMSIVAVGGLLAILWLTRHKSHQGIKRLSAIIIAVCAVSLAQPLMTSAQISFNASSNQAIDLVFEKGQTDPVMTNIRTDFDNNMIVNHQITSRLASAVNKIDLDVDGVDLTTSNQVVSQGTGPTAGSENLDFTLIVQIASDLPVGDYSAHIILTAETPGSPQATACMTSAPSSTSIVVDKTAGLIPVTYTGDTTTPQWQVADSSNWCNYDSGQWANAVTVRTEKLSDYQNTVAGTMVDENDVLGYWVYVPRYRYQLQGTTSGVALTTSNRQASPQEFQIAFEKAITPKSNSNLIGGWSTHPAFTFGTTELNGIWVGKFETTGTDSAPTIKPSAMSLRNQNVSQQFNTACQMSSIGCDGFTTGSDTHNLGNFDARLPRNDDWGAITYLSHSKYGTCDGAGNCNEVWINNSPNTTGCAGGSVSAAEVSGCNNYYYTANGRNASTTQTIYGIYDMSGGAWEYTMGWMNTNDADLSGFASTPAAKYFNDYPYSTTNSWSSDCTFAICGGQAVFETAGWYGDYNVFVGNGAPWFIRSASYYKNSSAGIFAFYGDLGYASWDLTFHAVANQR